MEVKKVIVAMAILMAGCAAARAVHSEPIWDETRWVADTDESDAIGGGP